MPKKIKSRILLRYKIYKGCHEELFNYRREIIYLKKSAAFDDFIWTWSVDIISPWEYKEWLIDNILTKLPISW